MGLGTSGDFTTEESSWSAAASAAVEAYRFAQQTTSASEVFKVAHATTTSDILGITKNLQETVGGEVGVACAGIGLLRVNGNSPNIAAGDPLRPVTSAGIGGKATAGQTYGAIALEPSTADGDLIRVLITQGVVSITGAANLVQSTAASVAVKAGVVTLDGSNPTPVATGLATIVSATATMKNASAPGDDPVQVTVDFSGSDGTLNIYAWKHDGTDPTLVASTNNAIVVCYQAWGTVA